MKTSHVVLFTLVGVFAGMLMCSGGLLVAVSMAHSRRYGYQSWGNQAQPAKTAAVLVARQDLPAGTRVAEPEAVLRVRLYRIGEEPADAVTDYNQVRGQTLQRALRTGEVCALTDVFAQKVQLPEGMRALAIRTNVPDTMLVALQPGTRIDLSGTVVNDGTGRVQTLAENVLVLAVSASGGATEEVAPASPPGTSNNVVRGVTITVAVTTEQARALAGPALQGGIGVTVRPPGD